MLEILIALIFHFTQDPALTERATTRACEVSEHRSHANLAGNFDGLNYTLGGENLAFDYYEAGMNDFHILSHWIQSPAHLYNLQTDFTHFGVGRCNNAVVLYLAK